MTASVTNPFLLVFPKTPIDADLQHDGRHRGLCAGRVKTRRTDRRPSGLTTTGNSSAKTGPTSICNGSSTIRPTPRAINFKDLHEKALERCSGDYEQPDDAEECRLRSDRPTRRRGTQRADGSNFIAKKTNSSRPARICPFTANRSIRPSTNRTSSLLRRTKRCVPTTPEDLRRQTRRSVAAKPAAAATSSTPGRKRRQTAHPLIKDDYKFIFHTPKYRHGSHTTPIDTDMIAMLFGPFGDIYRRDKRSPFVTEGYVDINPVGRSGTRRQ